MSTKTSAKNLQVAAKCMQLHRLQLFRKCCCLQWCLQAASLHTSAWNHLQCSPSLPSLSLQSVRSGALQSSSVLHAAPAHWSALASKGCKNVLQPACSSGNAPCHHLHLHMALLQSASRKLYASNSFKYATNMLQICCKCLQIYFK